MQDVVVVNLHGGVPSTFVERAFAQLGGFASIAERGLLWSHGVVTHTDADAALEAWVDVPGSGSLFDVYRRAGYHTVCIGAPPHVARSAETRPSIAPDAGAEAHDASAAFHALKCLLDPHDRPLFVMVCLRCGADVHCAASVSSAPRSFSAEEEELRLPPSVHDAARNALPRPPS